MSDARLHEITQQARETVEKRKEKETASRLSKESTYMRPIVKKIWKFRAEDQFTRSFDSESERQIHELTCKIGMKKTAEQGKNKEVLHEVGESKKRKGSSDVIKGAEEPGQAQESKKRKLLKSGPVFRYLSKEAKKKLTSFWRSAAATSDCGIIVCKIMKHFVLNEELQSDISDEECNKIRAEILEQFITDEVGSWQSQENEEVEQAEEQDCANAYELRPRANVNRATMEEPRTSVTPTKRRQNQGEVQSKSKHNNEKLDAEGKQVTYRSNLQAMVNLMRDLKLQEHHLILLRKTPFWLLIDALKKKKLSNDNCTKFDKVALKIIKSYDHEGKTFKIGGRRVNIQANDVALIFGIVSGEEPITIQYQKRNEVQLLARRSLTTKGMTTKIVGNLIGSIIENDDEESIKDVVRLVCLYLCGTLFFSGRGIQISWSFVQLMEDLPAMSNYNWSQAILDNLRKSVEAYPTKPKNVAGCVMLLLYWLCKKTNIIEQETKCSTVPRILKWNLPKLKKKLEGIESLDNFTNVQLLDSTLQRTDREVRVFRTLRNEQNTSNMIQGNSEHNERQCDEDHGSTGKDDEDHGISEHDDSPEHDSEIQHESTEKRSEDHGSEENEEQQCDEDHGSTGKDDEDHEISEHDDSPEHDNEIQHESTEKRSEDHGSEENEEQRTPIYVPYCGSLALVSEDGLEKLDFNQTEEQSEQQSPMYLDSAMTGKSTLNVLSEAAAIEHSWSLVYKRRSKMAGTESQKLIKSTEPEQPSCLFLDSTSTLQGETPAIEKQSDFNLDSALQKENEAANCRSTEPEQPSCLFLDSISTLQGETPAIEKQSGFYLDSTLQKENEAATCKIRELLEQIDEERGLKEEQMEENEELLKQIEELRALKEDEIKELKSIIEANNEAATSRSRELMEQIDEERGLKEKEMEKNKEQVKQIEELKCEAVKQQEENAAKIAELVVLFDEERGLKEEEMEKNKELVKQMEELKCEVVKKQEENAARIAELENQGAVMNKEKAKLINKIDEVRKKREEEVKNISQKIHSKELDELSKAYLEMKKIRKDYGAQIVLKDEKIKMLEEEVSKQQMAASVGSELQVVAPVGSELQVAAPVGSELQMAALTPPQNIDCEEECVVDEIAPEKDVQVQKLIKEIKKNYPDAEVLENAVHRMNKAFLQSPNSYIKRLKKRTGRKTTQTAEYHYTLLMKQPRKAAELNVQTFQDYEAPIAKQQTTNVEHEEHSNDQENEKNVIDFIPEQYRDMVRIILEDGSSIRVWAAEDLECFVFDDDFRVLVLDEALTTGIVGAYSQILMDQNKMKKERTTQPKFSLGLDTRTSYMFSTRFTIMKLKAERTDVLKQGLAAAMECTFIHFPLVFFNHWTLLVLNTLNGRWDFYNSLARLNKKHVEKAKQLVNQIANDINTIMVEGTVQITNKVLDVRLEFSDVIAAKILRCLFVSDLYCRKTNSQSLIACIKERFGVLLLLNLGGPDTLNDVQPFWFNLFADLAIALRNTLESKETPVHVYVAMRYWHPFTEEAVEQAKDNDDKDGEDDDDDDEDDNVEEDDDDNDENDDNEDDEDEDEDEDDGDEDEDDGDEDKGNNDMHYQQVITNGHKSPLPSPLANL
ncbi:hypothetical protein RHGRI_007373 [Rhododendron griersonianum]|uniref:Ubiquitin-like protease family profile domain-containing protein n=1 Tax=Rhododendron griersonianum TaxID=479676 RepID=A0AAV6KY00_9ERIC|nr:hypothetical protein RHGRI_007373 [Rhododendron griersonianum]